MALCFVMQYWRRFVSSSISDMFLQPHIIQPRTVQSKELTENFWEILRPIVNGLHDNWEDWLPQIAAAINCSVNDSTGKPPYFIMFGVEKRFPYDLLTSSSQPVYKIDTYAKQQIQVFSQIHSFGPLYNCPPHNRK